MSFLTERLFVIYMCIHGGGFLMLCLCIEVAYVCNFMCYVQRVELKLCSLGNCALEKLSIIIIIIIIIIIKYGHGRRAPSPT